MHAAALYSAGACTAEQAQAGTPAQSEQRQAQDAPLIAPPNEVRVEQLPQLAQLLSQGRYVEAAALALAVSPPSAEWQSSAVKQSSTAAVTVHVDAGDGAAAGAAPDGSSVSTQQKRLPAVQEQQINVWRVSSSALPS